MTFPSRCVVREIILVLIPHFLPKNNRDCLCRAKNHKNVFVYLFSDYEISVSLVAPLVMQITEADAEIFLLFGIQAKAASTTCALLANNWRGYYITRMDCPMSKRPGVTLSDSLPIAKTVILFIQLSDCVAECHLAFKISALNFHCFNYIPEWMLQREAGVKQRTLTVCSICKPGRIYCCNVYILDQQWYNSFFF